MYGDGKSDRPIVPMKPTNNSGHGEARPHPVQPLAESVEERGRAEGNSRQDAGSRTQSRCIPQDAWRGYGRQRKRLAVMTVGRSPVR